MNPTASIRVLFLVLLGACAVVCETPPSTGLPHELQAANSCLLDTRGNEIKTLNVLPDAPSSVQPPVPTVESRACVEGVVSPVALTAPFVRVVAMRNTELGHFIPKPQSGLFVYKAIPMPEAFRVSNTDPYLSLLRQDPRYYAATSKGLWDEPPMQHHVS